MLHLQINHPMLSMCFCSVFEIFFSNQRSGVLILIDGKMRSILKWFTCVEILFLLNGNPYGNSESFWARISKPGIWNNWTILGQYVPEWPGKVKCLEWPRQVKCSSMVQNGKGQIGPRMAQNCPNAVLPQRSSIEDLLKWSSFYTKVLISSFFP